MSGLLERLILYEHYLLENKPIYDINEAGECMNIRGKVLNENKPIMSVLE